MFSKRRPRTNQQAVRLHSSNHGIVAQVWRFERTHGGGEGERGRGGGGVEELRGRGAEGQRGRGAEVRRSRGAEELRCRGAEVQ